MTSSTPEVETFVVIIPRTDNTQVLLAEECGNLFLPRVTIPKWQRIAPSITKRVEELWNLKTICLFQATPGNHLQQARQEQVVVLEVRDLNWQPSANLSWRPRDSVADILSPLDADTVGNALKECDSYDKGVLPGPFARRGWVDELMRWIQREINGSGLRLTGKLLQLNASPSFCLIRFETSNGSAVWFKAVGKPNLHEYGVTLSLARQRPEYFPEILAAHENCNGWLMKEVDGILLEQTRACQDWVDTAMALGRMQADFVSQEERLLAMGCWDLRLSTIVPKIDGFLDAMEGLMLRQRSATPRPLSKVELLQLGRELKQACYRLAELGFPDSLGHCDLNPGNVIVTGHTVAFIDLVEAYVGNPLPTFEYLSLAFGRYLPECQAHRDLLYRGYADSLTTTIRPALLSKASAFAPLLGVLFAAIHREPWADRDHSYDALQEKYFRGLTRRMQREIEALKGQDSSV